MTLDQYAQTSNFAAGSAFVVLFLAFLAHAAEWLLAHRAEAPVMAEVSGHDGSVPVDETPPVADRLSGVGVSLTVLGAALLILAVLTRGFAAQRLPLGNMYEFGLVGVMVSLVVYLVMVKVAGIQWLGSMVLVIGLLILGIALSTYVPAGPLVPALDTFWKYIHVTSIMLAAGFFIVGAAASAMFLVKDRSESRGTEGGALQRFPAAARMDRLAFRANAIGFPLWTFGTLITGPIWAHYAWSRYWAWDPKEVWALVTWIVYAGYLHARVTAGWKGRRASWIGLIGFSTFIISYYVINLFATGLHSYAK